MLKNSVILSLSICLCMSLLGCVDKQTITFTANDLDRSSVCKVDGMILLDYPGPKGQIVLKDGERWFFCDTRGFFDILFDKESHHKISKAFVQDFGQREWRSYTDRWIDVEQAFFVLGGNKKGAMGPTIVSFAQNADAEHFIKQHGGSLLDFKALTPDVLEKYNQQIRESFRQVHEHPHSETMQHQTEKHQH